MPERIRVGEPAPDFALPNQAGTIVRLREFRGKKNLVLYFYPRDESIGCTAEACSFRDNYTVFTDLGAEIIGVSPDSTESHQAFIAHHNLPFTLLSDTTLKVRDLYKAFSILGFMSGRVTYIIDKQGIIRHIFSSQLRPTRHIQEAIRILKDLEPEQLSPISSD